MYWKVVYVFDRLLCKPITVEMSRVTGRTVQTVTVDVSVGLLDLVEAVFDRRPSTASFCGFHLPIENVLPEFTEVSTVGECWKRMDDM